jgi:hypothetical protein
MRQPDCAVFRTGPPHCAAAGAAPPEARPESPRYSAAGTTRAIAEPTTGQHNCLCSTAGLGCQDVSSKPATNVCKIIPRPSSRADELKASARAIQTWHHALAGWEWDKSELHRSVAVECTVARRDRPGEVSRPRIARRWELCCQPLACARPDRTQSQHRRHVFSGGIGIAEQVCLARAAPGCSGGPGPGSADRARGPDNGRPRVPTDSFPGPWG